MVKGIHHVALRCSNVENFKETLDFYENVIGMKEKYKWGEGSSSAAMLELNGDVLEIFAEGAVSNETGSVNHFAFLTDDPDDCIRRVKQAGYPVVSEPGNVDIPLEEPAGKVYPLRVAFCTGPVGEMIEFFCERGE